MKRLLKTATFSLAALFAAFTAQPAAAQSKLQTGDYVGVIGDSITEQRQYSKFIELYLLCCQPAKDLRASQFGWGGETSWGFNGRMHNDQIPFKVTVATTCFGMNDGGYGPMDEGKAKRYYEAMTSVVKKLKEGGTRFIVVGSPGAVDFDTFRKDQGPEKAKVYNATLAAHGEVGKRVAAEQGVAYADVIGPMLDVMTKAKAKYGPSYHVGGNDGVHPDNNGHLVMAYAFLKALGCDGEIGTITFNAADGTAQATDGHKVLSASKDSVALESSKYPFCFIGDPSKPNATSGVIEFFPFNDDLNRFKLIVTGLPSGSKAKVTWGKNTKEFDAAALAKGINLAAEFIDGNPFADAFNQVEQKVSQQQGMEVGLVKNAMHGLIDYEKLVPEEKPAFDRVRAKLLAQDKEARDASAAAVKPVKHEIKVEVVK